MFRSTRALQFYAQFCGRPDETPPFLNLILEPNRRKRVLFSNFIYSPRRGLAVSRKCCCVEVIDMGCWRNYFQGMNKLLSHRSGLKSEKSQILSPVSYYYYFLVKKEGCQTNILCAKRNYHFIQNFLRGCLRSLLSIC